NADWRPSKTLRAANQRKSDNREGTTVPSSQLRQHKEAMRWIWTRQERARDSIYPTTSTKDERKTTPAWDAHATDTGYKIAEARETARTEEYKADNKHRPSQPDRGEATSESYGSTPTRRER